MTMVLWPLLIRIFRSNNKAGKVICDGVVSQGLISNCPGAVASSKSLLGKDLSCSESFLDRVTSL